MQMDMHFHGVYALARAAGVKPGMAKIIACASQYVDDAIENKTVILGNKAVIASMTSHKPIDYQNSLSIDQWNVWSSFHFLPGLEAGAQSFAAAMSCSKNSRTADSIVQFALANKAELFGPHLAGVVAHVYADTFSHYGFVGLCNEWNKVDEDSIELHVQSRSIRGYLSSKLDSFLSGLAGTFAETIPVGHGAVATLPDRPYLHWEYTYKSGKHVVRHNIEDYVEACKGLHAFFGGFAKNNPIHGAPLAASTWDAIENKVRSILALEANMEDRIDAWTGAIASGDLFPKTQADASLEYGEPLIKAWGSRGICDHYRKDKPMSECNGYLFNKAAWKYRNYVLDELLPSAGLIA
jgi:hypothetical protein